MRDFNDTEGGHWQAALLDASYGNTLVVFSRLGNGTIRKTALNAENMRLAEQQLMQMDESQLRSLLAESVPWEAS